MAEIRLENVSKVFWEMPSTSQMGFWERIGTLLHPHGYSDYQRQAKELEETDQVDIAEATGYVKAMDQVDLLISDGETISLVGPSGCGKTTLLRVVAGLLDPDEGEIYFDGKPMVGVQAKDRGIGMVFQSYALYPHMKGEGNLAFFFKVRHRPDEEMMERIRITSEIMGIGFELLLSRKPGTLSGGQQQRVAIGRCIVRDPSLFLFDEPLSNLDAKLRSSTRVEIKRLLQHFHITAIYVTHDQTEAITLGDRIGVMRAGKIEQLGTYHEIMENPVNAFVAGFLGLPPMNLLRGWRATEDGHLEGELGRVAMPAELADLVTPGSGIILGFRSEAAAVVPEGEPLPFEGLVIDAEVINSEPDFARHFQVVNVQAGSLLFGVQAPLEAPFNTGWPVQVVIPEDRAYLFDEATEMRIAHPEPEEEPEA
jgi:ABC-type sugar transport system ATPase subunit